MVAEAAAVTGSSAFGAVDVATPAPSIVQTTAPMGSTSPSLAMVFNTPAFSAVSSKVALSDSSSASASSMATWSPSFLSQRDKVTSVIDSPTVGTFTSNEPPVLAAGAAAGAGAGAASAAGAGAASLAGADAPPSSMVATAAPMASVSPSLAIVFKVPAF